MLISATSTVSGADSDADSEADVDSDPDADSDNEGISELALALSFELEAVDELDTELDTKAEKSELDNEESDVSGICVQVEMSELARLAHTIEAISFVNFFLSKNLLALNT